MKKKSSTKKPLVSKADLDKINDAFTDNVIKTNDMYQKAFSEKVLNLAAQISDMVTEEVNTDSEAVRRTHGKKITKTLNEMYKLFAEHEDSVDVMFREMDEGLAVITLLKFADKVKMFRLLHIPKFDSKTSTISFKVYIAHMWVCWCRIRTIKRKNGVVVLTRFTN